MQLLFWVLQITIWPALCYEIKHVETRRVQLFLEKNGELEDSSRLPNCGSAKRIFLNSHTYSRLQCSRAACDSVQEEAISQSTAFQLNQHCSFRHKCKNLNFPVPTSLRNLDTESLAVTIQYQCIDDQSSIINMCEKHKMNFTDTLHLTFNYDTKNSEDCVCWVNNGAFSLTIMDLRLKSRNKDVCSAAKLVINAHHYTCDPQSDSYGAIFGETIRDSMPLGAFISLVPKNTLPEMIWIQLTPEESSRIDCHGDRIASEKSTNMVTVTTKPVLTTTVVVDVVDTTENLHPIVTTTSKTDDTSMDDTKDQTYMTLIALSIIAIIFMLTTLILAIRICLIRRLERLKVLRLLANRLATSKGVNPDLTVPVMKVLAYLKPLKRMSYLNGMQDKLKDLVFHLHLKTGKTVKEAPLDLKEAKKDFFPKETSRTISKLLHLQGRLIKEHDRLVILFEHYAFDLWKYGRTEDGPKIVAAKRAALKGRETILRNQIVTLSIQLAILIERHMIEAVESLRDDLKTITTSSDAPSEIVDSLEAIIPEQVSHQIYVKACKKYTYPIKPRGMTYDPDHDWIVNEPVSGSSDGDDVTIMIPEYDFPEPQSVPSASSEKDDSTMPLHSDCNKTDSTTINGNDDIMVPEYDSPLPTFVPSNSSERDESTMPDYNNNNNDVREATTIPDDSDCTNDSSTDRKASSKNRPENEYATALKVYLPTDGRGLKINTGDTVKTKVVSICGEWRFGFKKYAFGLKKKWGFFPTPAVTNEDREIE